MVVAKFLLGVALAGLVLGSADARAGDALPPIDSLTATSDYSRFMQPDVPHAVRAAALARLWVLDPTIHSGEGAARDGDGVRNAAGAPPSPAEVRATLKALHRRLDHTEPTATLVDARGALPGG